MEKQRKFRNRSNLWLESAIIESDAFLELSGKAAIVCLMRFYQKAFRKTKQGKKKLKKPIITNQNEIIFTYAEAKELGIKSSRTFNKVIHELVEDLGFIDIAEHGEWYGKKPNKFAISERWKRYGTAEYEKVKIPRILPEGKGFQKQNSLYPSKRNFVYQSKRKPKN